MLIPIRCFTCGEILADKYDYYVKRVEELRKKAEEKSEDSKYKNFDHIKTKEVLDELGLKSMCCRRHMLGHVDLYNII